MIDVQNGLGAFLIGAGLGLIAGVAVVKWMDVAWEEDAVQRLARRGRRVLDQSRESAEQVAEGIKENVREGTQKIVRRVRESTGDLSSRGEALFEGTPDYARE
ncbi:MAG: hypothetical protein BLITH_1274 [Brockia lithotrophica]|uniref:Uncharacterized protein n=1 Tax=Brockia lithotrophica TaxID=933949 RepID=A0A2T5G625_9BACL|nr:MAG: hypothetical protein BLITH_1274 [Brockia lithotrophica]